MYTGTCLRPSWTAMVCPTMSGMIVDRRDQVLITRFSLRLFSASTLRSRWSSTNGPFFRLRGTSGPPASAPGAALAAPADDQFVGFLVTGPSAALLLPPRRHRMPPTAGLALAAAERVVDRVHGHATGLGADALPPVATCLAPRHQLGLEVADLAEGSPAVDRHAPHLGRGQPEGGEGPLLGHQLHAHPGTARELAPRTRPQLDVVHDRAHRDVPQRQGVAGTDLGSLAALEQVPDLDAGGRQDVALLAVEIVQQGDAGVAVGVVLDRRHLGRHPVLVPLEVDDPVALLVPTAAVAGRLASVGVASAGAGFGHHEGPLGTVACDLGEVRDGLEPAAGAGRLAFAEWHRRP